MSKKKSFSIGAVATNVMSDIADRVETTEIKAKNDIREISVHKIKASDNNTFGMRDIEKLADSIKEYGQLENAVVRRIENPEFEFEMISGHRRQEAIKLLGQETILCKVVEADDLLAEAMLIIANLETRELSDLEKSNSAVRLVEIVEQRRKSGENFEGKKTREIVAEMMSTESEKVAPAKVQKLLKVQELIPEFKEQLDKGDLSLEKANQLAQMTHEQQKMVFDMFQQGMKLTAKDAKEIKDSLQKSDNERETVEKIKKELEEKQEELKKANEKLKKVENENDSLNNMVRDFESKISKIEKNNEKREKEYKKRKTELENEIEERKKELEKNQKEEIEKASKEKIDELEEKLKKLQEEEEKKRVKKEEEINELRKKLEEKEKEKKDAEIKEKNIIGNMEIKALAEQARKILSSLTKRIAEYNEIEGFEINEEVQKVLSEISEYEK